MKVTGWTRVEANSAVDVFPDALVGGLAEEPDDAASAAELDAVLGANLSKFETW